ncbi:hypothetical protein [Pseudofrankia sp. BMG5.37]|uniref:hypothetical protein n=1 Tax=Pseudofrankia sp. BMG5.37 TaxID=3050035 RepID=UPI002894AE89|nr:hypothetical protein [Pseudofrankia sp. BMG5.37]MDT3446734.1 hypothetical protein [Pseudofrankia sp. BMG5.37]
MPVSPRLERRIRKDFPADSEAVISMLHEAERISLGDDGDRNGDARGRERILGAVIVASRGDIDRLIEALELLVVDWRDLLMEADLGEDDWPSRLDEFLDSEDG